MGLKQRGLSPLELSDVPKWVSQAVLDVALRKSSSGSDVYEEIGLDNSP